MTATKTRRAAATEATVRPFKVTIDSPLCQRISVDVMAESADAARETVAGWFRDAMSVEEK